MLENSKEVMETCQENLYGLVSCLFCPYWNEENEQDGYCCQIRKQLNLKYAPAEYEDFVEKFQKTS